MLIYTHTLLWQAPASEALEGFARERERAERDRDRAIQRGELVSGLRFARLQNLRGLLTDLHQRALLFLRQRVRLGGLLLRGAACSL